MLTGNQLGQVFALLRLAAVATNLVHAQVRMRAVGQAHRSGRAADLLHCDHMLEIPQARAAIVLFHRQPEQAEFAHLGPEIARELVGAVNLVRTGRDQVLGKATHRVAEHVGGFAEIEIETRVRIGEHSRLLPRLSRLC